MPSYRCRVHHPNWLYPSTVPKMLRLTACIMLVAVGACAPSEAPLRSCTPVADFTPRAATIAVAESVIVTMTVTDLCPTPVVRNETPTILRVDRLSPSTLGVVGLSAGEGLIHIASGVDTTVADVAQVTVAAAGAVVR